MAMRNVLPYIITNIGEIMKTENDIKREEILAIDSNLNVVIVDNRTYIYNKYAGLIEVQVINNEIMVINPQEGWHERIDHAIKVIIKEQKDAYIEMTEIARDAGIEMESILEIERN